MFRKSVVLFAILVFIVFGNGCGKQEMVTEFDFIAASSIEILQNTTDQMANGKLDLLGVYMESSDFFVLPKGTKIRILQTNNDKYVKCLVLDGRHMDKEFWTFSLSFDYGSDIPFDMVCQAGSQVESFVIFTVLS